MAMADSKLLIIKKGPLRAFFYALFFLVFAETMQAQPAYVFSDQGEEKLAKGDVAGALKDFDAAIKADSKHALSYARRGRAHALNGRKDLAQADWTKAIQLKGDLAEAYLYRSDFYLKNNDKVKALADLNKLIDLDPSNKSAYENRGYALKETGDATKALDDFSKAISMGVSNEKILLSRAELLLKKETGKAMQDLNAVLKLNPKNVKALELRAQAYFNTRKFDEALKDLEAWHAVEGNKEALCAMRVQIYALVGQADKSLPDLNYLIDQLKSKDKNYLALRADANVAKGDAAAALKDINKLILMEKESPEWLIKRAEIYLQQGKSKEPMAINDLKKAIAIDANNIHAYERLSALYVNANKWDEGMEACDKAIALKETPDLFYLRSKCHFKKGNTKSSCKDLEKARQLGHPEAAKDMATICR
jgi:tetratricopeptide (TPR) repeat protein